MSGLPSTRIAPNPRRLTSKSPSLIGKLLQHGGEAERDARHALVVEFLGCIARQMVVGVSVEGGVGDHDGRIAVLTKRPVIGPGDAGNEGGRCDAFRRKL